MTSWLFPPLAKNGPVSRETLAHIREWVADESRASRSALGERGMGKAYRQKALSDIAARTPTKTIDGQKHYLLHRTMGSKEFETHVNGGLIDIPNKFGLSQFTNFTSWGSNPNLVPRNGRTHIVAAWVPESHISFYPFAYKEKFEKMFPYSDANRFMDDEKEAIVKPGKFRMVHYTATPDDSDGPYLKYQDIITHENDTYRKVNNE